MRQLATEADQIAKARGTALLRGAERQAAALETTRDEVGYHKAWARWSATADELAHLAATILGHPALTVPDLAVKFGALAWLLLSDGAVVDHGAERHVRAFARELRRVSVTKR